MAVAIQRSHAVSIPPDLLEQATQGNLLLFLGERTLRNNDGAIAVEQWVYQLADQCGLNNATNVSFSDVAQVYEDAQGRATLVRFMRDQMANLSEASQPIHTLIAGLISCTAIVTISFDQEIEQAFTTAGRPLLVLNGNELNSNDTTVLDLSKIVSAKLRDAIKDSFNDSELRNLCQDLGIDYDSLAGGSKIDKARELVEYCSRRNCIADLVAICQTERPHISWPTPTNNRRVAEQQHSSVPEGVAQLYRLCGLIETGEALLLTSAEYEAFGNKGNLSPLLQSQLASKTILLIGCDLHNVRFQLLYDKAVRSLDTRDRLVYALVDEMPSPLVTSWCKRQGIVLQVSDAAAFLRELTQQAAHRLQTATATLALGMPDVPLPERPYKYLDFYDANDAGIFFGRRAEINTLSALIVAHRLMIVYGASGVGKTSLLLAGAQPCLQRLAPPYQTLYVRVLEDPASAIRNAVHRLLPDITLSTDDSLVDFLSRAINALGSPLVIVLDQFEEFFIRLSSQFREAFVRELGRIYDARDVPVKVVISLRGDWLHSMAEIEARIPEVFRIKLRVQPLTCVQAQEAITAPVERLGARYEPQLVERLLDDLGGGSAEVLPPQLQLVCSTLYDNLDLGERLISLALYERLGGARGVLQQYLEDELARLNADDRTLARGALSELVTSQGTKAVKDADELALGLQVRRTILLPVLEKLVHARLLRMLEREQSGATYELAHEYLIREISLSAETQQRKEMEELVAQEVENWQRFDTLLGADKLAKINEVRTLLRLNDAAQELLLRSALDVGYEIEYWLERVEDPVQRIGVLVEKSTSPLIIVRRRTAVALGTQDLSAALEPLLYLALHDSDIMTRELARASLACLRDQRAAILHFLRAAVDRKDLSLRHAALETMAVLPLRDIPSSLRPSVLTTQAQLWMIWLIGQSVATPTRRSVATAIGALVLFVVSTYIVAYNSYYITTAASPDRGDSIPVVVIRQGIPWLDLPGIGQELVQTDISLSDVDNDHLDQVNNRQHWGLWSINTTDGGRRWGQEVVDILKPVPQATLYWYLIPDHTVTLSAISRRMQQAQTVDQTELPNVIEALGQISIVEHEQASQISNILRAQLKDSDSSVRGSAVEALAQVSIANPSLAGQVAEALLPLMRDGDSTVRHLVALTLGQVSSTTPSLAGQIIEALLPLLRDDDSSMRSSAADTLGGVGSIPPRLAGQVIEALIPLLSDTDAYVRSEAVEAIEHVGSINPSLARQLIESLLPVLHDTAADVRFSAARALGQVGSANPLLAGQLIESLLPLLHDTAADVRFSAARALGQVGSTNPSLAGQAIEVLLPLLQDSDTEIRNETARTLGQVGSTNSSLAEQVIKALLPHLRDNDSYVPSRVSTALGQVGSTNPSLAGQVIEALLPLLHNSNTGMRDSASNGLKQVGSTNSSLAEQVVEALLPLLHDGDSEVRISAADILGKVSSTNSSLAEQIVEALLPLLHDGDSEVRISAADILGKVGSTNSSLAERVVEALLPLLHDTNHNVLVSVIMTFGQIDSIPPNLAGRVIEALLPLLHSDNIDLHSNIRNALVHGYAQQFNQADAQSFIDKLGDPLNAPNRPIAARVLFLLALHDATRGQAIRQRLEGAAYIHSREPITRIWSNKTLAMLDIVDWAHTAIKDKDQHEALSKKLDTLLTSGSFFGEDFTWAVDEAKRWIAEQTQDAGK